MRRLLAIALIMAAVQCHATNFTDVTTWKYYTSNSVGNELVISIREHQRLLSQSEEPAFIGRGSYVQGTNFWWIMQNWVSNNASSFLNTRQATNLTLVPFAPRHTWQTVLDNIDRTNGLRRAKFYDPTIHDWTDPRDIMWTNSYAGSNGWGHIQAGDILGPWIIDDLQLALWEERLVDWSVGFGLDEELSGYNGAKWYATGGANIDSSASYAAEVTAWGNGGWVNTTTSNGLTLYVAQAQVDYEGAGGTWDFIGNRERNRTIVNGYPSALVDMGYSGYAYYQPVVWRGSPITNQVGYDFDSQGWTFNAQYYGWEGWTNQAAYTSSVMQFDFSLPQPNPVTDIWASDPSYSATADTNINAQVRTLKIIFTPTWIFKRP